MLPQILLIFLAAFMQGINLVIYPSASTLLIDSRYHSLTVHEYGFLFVPMIAAALLISYFVGYFEEKKGHLAVFMTSLFFNALSLLIFASTVFLLKEHPLNFVLLLVALFSLGLGFGSMLSILTPYTLALFPKHPHGATVAVYGVLCLGASLSPIFFHWSEKVGLWWMDPLMGAAAFMLLFLSAYFFFPNQKNEAELFPLRKKIESKESLPLFFWLFFASILLYGLISTLFANWAMIYLNHELKLSNETASLALSFFWGMMMVGRIVIVGGERFISPKITYITMPLLMMITSFLIPFTSSGDGNIALFAFAGVAFSATFPFTYSFAAEAFPNRASLVSGRITAGYMVGFGVAAYGVEFLYDDLKISLKEIFFYSWTLALLMFLIALRLMRGRNR